MSEKEASMSAETTIEAVHDGRIARLTLNRAQRGNAITFAMLRELADAVEQANLDPAIHVILLRGAGAGFCAGYDLGAYAAWDTQAAPEDHNHVPAGSPIDPAVQARNHDPNQVWDPVCDYQMMHRNVRALMSLFFSDKPVVCAVHGYCVAGGTDLALCADQLVIAEDAKIGYPPARVWGSPTTALWAYRLGAEKAKRLLFTGDCLNGHEAVAWGLAVEAAPPDEVMARAEALTARIALTPVNQLIMMKQLVNQTMLMQGVMTTRLLGTVFDGIARHTPEGYRFQQRAAEAGFRTAVSERDTPYGDAGRSTYKGPLPEDGAV